MNVEAILIGGPLDGKLYTFEKGKHTVFFGSNSVPIRYWKYCRTHEKTRYGFWRFKFKGEATKAEVEQNYQERVP